MNFSLKGNAIVISSLRHSGKSELARMLILKEKTKFQYIFVISPTNKCNCFYDFIDKKNIIDNYSDEWVNELFSKMEQLNLGKNEKSTDAVHTLLVIDDSASGEGFKNSKSLEKLFTIGRHYFISTLVICQRIKSLSTTIRINTNFLIVGNLNQQSKKLLLDEYTLATIEKEKFKQVYDTATKNFGFLIINNSAGDHSNLNSYYASVRVPIDKLKVH